MRIPVHPGLVIKEEAEVRGLSANRLARGLGVPANRVSEIIRGRRRVTAETALRLAAFFGNSPEFWLRLQMNHDLGRAATEHGKEIKRAVHKAA